MLDSTKNVNNRQEWRKNTGPLPVKMTNDYLFKALAQKDEKALKDLISACLHIEKNQIHSLEIANPIQLGEHIEEKDFILDVKVNMNNHTTVDLEMQVVNYQDWPERSLQYLCRSYDSLQKGERYLDSRTAIHVGILDFTLCEGETTFHESYKLMEVHSHKIFTDKFQLFILTLPAVNNASNEDQKFHTDLWGRFFKAKTWEELNMLAEKNEAIASATSTMFQLVADENIRMKMEAREDYYRRQRTQEWQRQQLQKALAEAEQRARKAEEEARQKDEVIRKAEEESRQKDEVIRKAEEESRQKDEALRKVKEELAMLRGQK